MKLAPEHDFVTFASVRPGRIPGVVSVEIQNLTAGTGFLPAVPLSNGGFDPVAVPALAGDLIEFAFLEASGRRYTETAPVPELRPPTILRTSVGSDGPEFPVDAITIVFTEPLDPSTVSNGFALTTLEYPFDVTVAMTAPWSVRLDLGTTLEPAAPHAIHVSSVVRSLSGRSFPTGSLAVATGVPPSFEVTESGRIAFVSDRNGTPHVYIVNPDGSGLMQLTPGEAPSWSPDGLRIAFHTPQTVPCPDGPALCLASDSASQIRVIATDHSKGSIVARAGARNPSWSSDGLRIAFERGGEIYVVGPDGEGEQLLISSESLMASTGLHDRAYNPSWSPDGLRIAFIGASSSSEAPPGILIADADGTGVRSLATAQTGRELEPAWKTDGTRVAFGVLGAGDGYGRLQGGWGGVASAAVDGSDVRVHAFGAGPDWSPSGTFLLYSRQYGDLIPDDWWFRVNERIFVAEVTSGRRRQIVPDAPERRGQAYADYDATWFRPGS